MNKKRKLGRKLLSFLLSLALVLGLMPGMSLTALAAYDGNPYASLVGTTTTVKFNEIDWYIIADDSTAVNAGTVTLLAKDPIGASKFHDSSNAYSSSTVKTYLDSLTATGESFEAVADAITPVTLTIYKYNSTTEVAETIQNAKLWLLSTSEAKELPEGVRECSQAIGAGENYWWLRSPGNRVKFAACVCGNDGYVADYGFPVTDTLGVRPALKLDLSKVTFDSTAKTFTVGSATVAVTGITLSPSTATVTVDDKVALTASIEPDNATDKTVKWSVGGTNAGAVKLYTDEACTTEVGTAATSTLTVYAKGISAGSAIVTATSNADSTKSASCDVTVSEPAPAHTHDEISFQPWTSTDSLPTESGSYYLTNDVTLSEIWTVPGTNNLCLNGHSINGPTNNIYVFNVNTNTTLNLYDCGVTAGTIIARYKNGVAVAPGSTFNLYGGKITSNTDNQAIGVENFGTFNMYGGEISGNKDTGVSNVNGTFTMTGGTIRDNGKGVANQDIFKLSGNPTITNNKSGTDDSAKDNNVSLADNKVITIDGVLSNTTPIGVTMSAPGVFTSGWNDKMSDKTPTDYFTSDDSAYTVQVDGNELKLAMIKTNPTVTAPTARNLIYNGQAQELVTAGEATGGEMYYAVTTENTAPADNLYTTSIPTKTNAGIYYVWYKGVGDGNHNDSTPACITVTIGKKAATISANAASKTYGDADPTLTANVNGAVGTEVLQYTLSRAAGENVNNYAITVTVEATANPNYDITVNGNTFTINKKSATITANAASKTYGDTDPTLTATVTGKVGNDTLNYTLGRTAGENVDGYTITVTANAADNPNYDITTNNGTFTINKKALTITADSATKVYDTTALTKDSYTNTDLAAGDSIESVTITGSQTTVASNDNVPSAAVIKKSGTDVTANYQITYVNGTLTVTQATTNTVTVDITGWTYGDSANAPTSEASFGANTVTYSYSDAQDGTYTATVPVNAGTWYVKASVAGTENYVAGEAVKSFTIAKREVVISGIVAVDKNYDETTNAPLDFSKVSIANLVAADAGKLTVTATGTFEDEKIGKDKKVTITDLTLTGEKAGNYVLAAEGQQTESKADISNMTAEADGSFVARVEDFNLSIKKVEGLDLELGKALCTPAELALYEAGAKIELDLEIRVAEGLMTDDVVSKVTGILWNQEHVTMHGAKYFDITLYKKVGDADPVKVTDLGDKSITIKMGVPEDMKNKDEDKTRTFFMVRMHDGEAAVLTRTFAEELVFNSNQFSTYAICYNDAPAWKPAPKTTESSNNTVTATVVAPKTSGTDETARTLLVFGTAFAVAAIVSRIYVFGRRKEEEE